MTPRRWRRALLAVLAYIVLVLAAPAFGGEVPRASEEDLALAAVLAYVPPGGTRALGEHMALANMLAKSLGSPFKLIGWGVEPDGSYWKVTCVYIGTKAIERRAVWRVRLDPHEVTAMDEYARETERSAVQMSLEMPPQEKRSEEERSQE